MKLLDDIITSVTETKEPISDILRRTLVLAHRLKNNTLKSWVEKELNGYKNEDMLPEYRKARGTALGIFNGPFGAAIKNQPLPSSILDEEVRHFATDINLHEPIAAYEVADPKEMYRRPWPADLTALYQSSFIQGYALSSAWMPIPGAFLVGLVDNIRTRLLTFALEIQAELPDEGEKAAEQIPPATVEKLVHVHIYGGNNVVGNVQEFNAPTVIAGNAESLKIALTTLGVPEDHLKLLDASLQEDGTYAVDKADPKPVGKKTLEWISTAAKKVGGGAVKISGAVAEEAIRAAVMRYLGF